MSSVSNDDLINSYQFIGVTPSEDVLNLCKYCYYLTKQIFFIVLHFKLNYTFKKKIL